MNKLIAGTAQPAICSAPDVVIAGAACDRHCDRPAFVLEQAAAVIGSISLAGQKTTAGADRVRTVVKTARLDAASSGRSVNSAASAMGSFEVSAGKMSQLVDVIEDIAFKTSVLALSAGPEAVWGGVARRGFGEVASEVRTLAQRSADAAKEIRSLISASSTQAVASADLVAEAGRALNRISGHFAEINCIAIEIAATSREQASALGKLNLFVDQRTTIL